MSNPNYEQAFLDALKSVGAPQGRSDDADEHAETAALDPQKHTEAVPPPPAAVTKENIWRHPDAHPTVLSLMALSAFGPDWLMYEPETLRVLIPEHFKTPSLSELNLAKLQACSTLHLVDSFWQRWEVFLHCLLPFNEELPSFTTMYVPTVAQCLVACDIAARCRDDVQWSPEMKAYIATVYRHDGIFLPISPGDFVVLHVPEEIDQQELAKRWPTVRAENKAPKGENAVDEQLRRLLFVHQYLEASRTRLQQQMHFHDQSK